MGTEGATNPAAAAPLHSLNCVYSLEKVIIAASCLDEKLTFAEDFSGCRAGR